MTIALNVKNMILTWKISLKLWSRKQSQKQQLRAETQTIRHRKIRHRKTNTRRRMIKKSVMETYKKCERSVKIQRLLLL